MPSLPPIMFFSASYCSHHCIPFRPKELRIHFHPPALLFSDAAGAWVLGAPTGEGRRTSGPSCGAIPALPIQASHGAGCWTWSRSMPLHVLMGSLAHRTRQTHLLPGTSRADGPHFGCVDHRSSRLSVPKYLAILGPSYLWGGSPVSAPTIPHLGAPPHLKHLLWQRLGRDGKVG